MTRSIFLLVFVCCLTIGHGQKFSFVKYGVEEGLAQSQVLAIRQDSIHQLWIATLAGLSRFDGRNFTNYSTADGLMSSYITALVIDKRQRIWIGSQLGISYYDGHSFKNFPLNKTGATSTVPALVEDDDGVIGIYNGELFHAAYSGVRPIMPPESSERFTALGKTNEGDVLASGTSGKIYRVRGKTWRIVYEPKEGLPANLFKAIITGQSGICWLLGTHGLLEWRQGAIFPSQLNIPQEILNQAISVYESKSGDLWFGCFTGVYQAKLSGATTTLNAANGFTDNAVFGVTEDVEGNLWFATNGSGMIRFANSHLTYWDQTNGLPNAIVVGIDEDESKVKWFGTFGGGLCSLQGDEVTHYKLPHVGKRLQFLNFCLAAKQGEIWLGTLNLGLWRFKDGKFENMTAKFKLRESNFLCGAKSPNGNLYFGSPDGLFEYSNDRLRKISSVDECIYAINVLPGDSILMGSPRGIILYCQGSRLGFCPQLTATDIRALARTQSGVALGSYDKGLFLIDLKGNLISSVNKSNGLSSNTIYSLAFDKYGTLWASTGYFLDKISFGKNFVLGSVKVFTKTDGINSAEGNLNGLLVDSDDNLWEGTNNGIYRMRIDAPQVHLSAPVVVLKQVSLFSQPIANTQYCDTLAGVYPVPVNLKLPFQKNHLSFEFQGISISDADQLKYQYYIPELDKGFSNPSIQNSVVYSNLASGSYHFFVRAINSQGTISEHTLEYDFVIETPFYRTTLFKIVLVIVFVALGIGILASIFSVRQKRHKLIAALRAEEQEKIRKRVTEDFHDEVGNKLTRITVLAEVLKKRIGEKNGTTIIDQIKENSQALYNGTTDIIRSLSGTQENFFDLLNRIREFGIDLFHETGIDFEFAVVSQEFRKFVLPADFSRDLLMIAKEAFNNILKHAESTEATVAIEQAAPDRIKMTIADNGKGFDEAGVEKGLGVVNIRRRVSRINGEVLFENRVHPGTRIIVQFSIPKQKN